MTFQDVLAQVIAWLQREQRVSYRALKRQLALDDDYLEDLKDELIYAKRLAVDKEGRVLVWTGPTAADLPAALSGWAPNQAPLTYTPPHLTDKILAARPALEGERKQVTVLFADLKDSTELIRGLDPEAAQQFVTGLLALLAEEEWVRMVERLLTEDWLVDESPYLRRIREEGSLTTRRRDILTVLAARFALPETVRQQVEQRLATYTDETVLATLLTAAARSAHLAEFLAVLMGPEQG